MQGGEYARFQIIHTFLAPPLREGEYSAQRSSPYLREFMAVWGRIRLLVLNHRRSRRLLPLLVFLFAGSGCAALVYEIVWFQLLQLVIGSSAVSLGLLLAAYMGGLCAGSALLPRAISREYHPLRVYAVLELGIGVLGLAVLFGLPLIGRMYVATATQGLIGLVERGIIAALCLLPPTALMGASLPAIARWVEATSEGVSWMGLMYSGNIAGAVFGCLLAGFYLLRVHDMAIATYVAVAVNAAVAFISFLASRSESSQRADGRRDSLAVAPGAGHKSSHFPRPWLIYTVIALSGCSALGAEVLWTRLLSLLLGGTVYTFAIILAVFLLVLWVGSGAGSFPARRPDHPALMLAASQALLVVAIAWTGYTLSHSLPYWPVDPWLSLNPWFNFELDLVRTVWAIFPATLLWGASFPLALASAARAGGAAIADDFGRALAGHRIRKAICAHCASFRLRSWSPHDCSVSR